MFKKLHSLENTELSEYCLTILEKHGISLMREFMSEKPEKLMKILNLNFEQIKKIKREFLQLYGARPVIMTDRFKEQQIKAKVYGTRIDALDNLLAPRQLLGNLSFWEICGPTGVGKTQLALTLMLNFVVNQVAPALYIDTKLDFSASRIKNMLKAREIEPELYAGIMTFIKVERVLSATGVVEMLEEFYKHLQLGNQDVLAIKMIIIDSLPSAWFLLKAETNRVAGKWLLNRLSQNINRLVHEYYITVICINLSLMPSAEENKSKSTVPLATHNDNDISDLIEEDDMELGNANIKSSYRPALGHCWLTKPHLRLSLEFPDNEDVSYKNDSSLRVIKLIKSTYSSTNLKCLVRLQPEGIV